MLGWSAQYAAGEVCQPPTLAGEPEAGTGVGTGAGAGAGEGVVKRLCTGGSGAMPGPAAGAAGPSGLASACAPHSTLPLSAHCPQQLTAHNRSVPNSKGDRDGDRRLE